MRSHLALLLWAAGCQSPEAGSAGQPIFDDGGDVVDDGGAHPQVFPFAENTLPYNNCTATLVAQDLLLTAAHCIEHTTTEFRAYLDVNVPADILFEVEQAIDADDTVYGESTWLSVTSTVAIYPGFTLNPLTVRRTSRS